MSTLPAAPWSNPYDAYDKIKDRTSCEWICGSPTRALMGFAMVTRPYEELTNCTFFVALKMHCFWPNQLIDELFIHLHRDYFHDCALTGRLLQDPPIRILGPFIGVPVLVTLLMTALVVWSGKCCQGIV
ncbi:receptor activity-modifying protein 1 isoform X4 [Salmo salar]|uniref:Receptor activity-modifying protein 1 n=1 Tax=Salmo salar TaxID=8030 RepID=B5X7R2_SALSA|nr:receptor activity-modifying protein 1 isoform X4 [Salmo salar]ACI66882.1 Receptor activity-modifying protein 1 precursor [Salmo salar]|eukprot:XP_014037365.1 PREDICTED: receptor activity-modifying protein 1-like isoform X5 [Salmo salar]